MGVLAQGGLGRPWGREYPWCRGFVFCLNICVWSHIHLYYIPLFFFFQCQLRFLSFLRVVFSEMLGYLWQIFHLKCSFSNSKGCSCYHLSRDKIMAFRRRPFSRSTSTYLRTRIHILLWLGLVYISQGVPNASKGVNALVVEGKVRNMHPYNKCRGNIMLRTKVWGPTS